MRLQVPQPWFSSSELGTTVGGNAPFLAHLSNRLVVVVPLSAPAAQQSPCHSRGLPLRG
jgi:hypothetical protein